MANFREVTTGGGYIYVSLPGSEEPTAEAGDVIAEGIYLGEQKGKFGNQFLVRNNNGDTIVLGGWGHLRSLLAKITEGAMVRITYTGQETLSRGNFAGKACHQFKLEVAESSLPMTDSAVNA